MQLANLAFIGHLTVSAHKCYQLLLANFVVALFKKAIILHITNALMGGFRIGYSIHRWIYLLADLTQMKTKKEEGVGIDPHCELSHKL